MAQEGTALLAVALPTPAIQVALRLGKAGEWVMAVVQDVIIGVDPHKLSATIEVLTGRGVLVGAGRFTTDKQGYGQLRRYVAAWPRRVWAVEGSEGAGRPLAQRLLEAGEDVVDVPAKLAARVRLFDTGHNRKTDARDAHSIAMVALRTSGLRVLVADGQLQALRMLADRRDELGAAPGADRRTGCSGCCPSWSPARRRRT